MSNETTIAAPALEPRNFRDLSAQQKKSGLAAWLGWMFDGLDMHLYTLVAAPFVMQLLHAKSTSDPEVGKYSSIIQAAFLIGWALGGAFFGRVGDLLGRTRALNLTILTYAAFTGLSFFAQEWWHLMIFRFLAALGIGGEWAVGASLLSESWPKRWRPWMAAVLQSGVNIGVLLAVLTHYIFCGVNVWPEKYVFLVGVLPALLTLWIRAHVPETPEWHAARAQAGTQQPPMSDLFRGSVRRTTLLVVGVCAMALTAHWAFMFWYQVQLRNLPEVLSMTDGDRSKLISKAMFLVMVASIAGNFAAAVIARRLGYARSVALLLGAYFLVMAGAYGFARDHHALMWWLPGIGLCQGVFALFTMYLPPLFPTLLRTTGAGFCYNIGRIFAAAGTVFFGLYASGGTAKTLDYRLTLLYAAFLFIPGAILALQLPEPPDEGKTGTA